jgi:hypothetical protein
MLKLKASLLPCTHLETQFTTNYPTQLTANECYLIPIQLWGEKEQTHNQISLCIIHTLFL